MSKDAHPSKPRPYWLAEPCPPWCTTSHIGENIVGDRYHGADYIAQVPLTLVNVSPDPLSCDPREEATVIVEQHFREVAPHIHLSLGSNIQSLDLTLSEAEAIGEALLCAVAHVEITDDESSG